MMKKGYRDRYFSDYEAKRVPANNAKGFRIEYQYSGFFCQWYDEKGHSRRFLKYRVAVVELLSLAAFVLSSLQQSQMNTAALAAGFGICAIVPWLLELAGSVMFLAAGEYVKERTRSETDTMIVGGAVIRTPLLLLSLLFGVIAVHRSGPATVQDVTALVGMLVSAGLSVTAAILHKKLYYRMYKNDGNGAPGKEC